MCSQGLQSYNLRLFMFRILLASLPYTSLRAGKYRPRLFKYRISIAKHSLKSGQSAKQLRTGATGTLRDAMSAIWLIEG